MGPHFVLMLRWFTNAVLVAGKESTRVVPRPWMAGKMGNSAGFGYFSPYFFPL